MASGVRYIRSIGRVRLGVEPRNGLLPPSAITEVEPEAVQIIFGQAWSDIEVDAVLREDRAMMRLIFTNLGWRSRSELVL